MLITGASRGIGAATARLAARRGYAVVVNFHTDEAAAHSVVTDVEAAGSSAVAIRADVGDPDDVAQLFGSLDTRFGRIDALVNNAGVLEAQMPLVEMDAPRLERTLRTNVIGPFLCAREAVRRMSTAHGGDGGAIVNLSSIAASLGSPDEYVDYAASKGAIDTMTIGLAREVADQGIRVNAVRPGVIRTDIHARGGEPGRVDRVARTVPMRRGGEPEEVASTVLWLLSEEASYITGALVDVSGGR